MAVIQTIGATEPPRVQVEVSGGATDVWLRRNIEQDTAEEAQGEDVVTCDFYRYDEVHFVAAGTPTATEVEADFEALWAAHERDGTPDSERIADLEEASADADEAVGELGALAADASSGVEELQQAVAELGALVASAAAEEQTE